ncbi:MAG: GntR family transcriptional regulator [Chloroflexota bacterium]
MSSTPHRDIYATLRQQIIQGTYQAGERLVEERLADQLGVSRTPVRQALTALASEGLVQLFPNRGALVHSFQPDEVRDSYDVRALLEGYAAFHTAYCITPEQLALLRTTTDEMEERSLDHFSDQPARLYWLVERNQLFHRSIIEASGNRLILTVFRQIVDLPLMFRSFYWYRDEERAHQIFFHRRIIDALAARDGERARILMQEHIHEGRDAVLRNIPAASIRQVSTPLTAVPSHEHRS